jgi:hypothetical protein
VLDVGVPAGRRTLRQEADAPLGGLLLQLAEDRRGAREVG